MMKLIKIFCIYMSMIPLYSSMEFLDISSYLGGVSRKTRASKVPPKIPAGQPKIEIV